MAGGILTLTTDFGANGPYVAAMKGVVLGLAPGTQIVDVSHEIPPQDVRTGAFVLGQIVEAFPEGTVHLAVVDPGVGTERRVIAAKVAGQWFVLPDNGLISGVLGQNVLEQIWEITAPNLRRHFVSSTFHGRDIMAPAAAHLLNGGEPAALGARVADPVLLASPVPVETTSGLVGEVVFVDSFGNLITNLNQDQVGESWPIEILGQTIDGLIRTYAERSEGSLVALIGSSGRLEVAVVNGDASKALQAGRGTLVLVRRPREALV